MVNLVSILAQDLHFVKNKINNALNVEQNVEPNILQYSSQLVGGENISGLIGVSDGEDEDEDEDENEDEDEDEDENEDENEDEDEEYDEDEDDDLDYCAENTQEHIKLLNLSLANDNIDNDLQIEELNNYSDLEDVKTIYFINEEENSKEENDQEKETENLEEVKEDLEEVKEDDVIDFEHEGTDTIHVSDYKHFLKNVSISDLEEIPDFTSKPEYKKMPTNKLREVVVSKGIITDASKLKKNEILKLLGDE
jgi:hypothetical protein